MRSRVLGTLLVGALVAVVGAVVTAGRPAPAGGALTDVAAVGSAAAGTPVVIPESVLLGEEQIPGVEVTRPEQDYDAYLRPPRPCRGGGKSDAMRLAAAHVHYTRYDPVDRPGWPRRPIDLMHLVMLFEDGGARQYMAELREDLRRCPADEVNDRTWESVREAVHGDSVLAQVTIRWTTGGSGASEKVLPFLVSRTGNAVVVLADLGYESMDGEEQPLLDLIGPAVDRARPLTPGCD